MNKLYVALFFPFFLFAQSYMISDIPLPKTYVLDLDAYECDNECLNELLENDMIFSFLAHANRQLQDPSLEEARMINAAIFNIGNMNQNTNFRIAILLPYKKIGKYATTTTNAVFAYLMTKNTPFEMKSYKIEDEEYETIENALEQVKADGINFVIAPLTIIGVENVITIDPELYIYFPTINKKDVATTSTYLTFGGIDYFAQSDMLLKYAVSPLVIFSDTSPTGKKLSLYQKESFLHTQIPQQSTIDLEDANTSADTIENELTEEETEEKRVIQFSVSKRTSNLERYLKENEEINDGSFFINTPIIKSGMIMSQLTLYDVNVTNILSTQINYNPLLLSMTQYRDREHMLLANSITKQDNILVETNALIGNDIRFDWINYSTMVGVDYFYALLTGEARVYSMLIREHQVDYDIELLKPLRYRFVKVQQEELPLEQAQE